MTWWVQEWMCLRTLRSWSWLSNTEMQFLDSIPRSFHRTICSITSSSTTRRIPGIRIPGKSWSRYCWTLRFSCQSFSMTHDNSWQWQRNSFWSSWFFRKHVLKNQPNSVYSGKPESRLGTPLELGIVEDDLLGTWDMPELLPVSES